MSATLISIVGPPAVGKTTLARLLAEDLGATLLLEDWEGNPFLAASYAGDAALRLPGQMYFLLSRVKQLALTTWPDEGLVVADYGFCQDRIYARVRLGLDEFEAYEAVARPLERVVQPPGLLICLDASEATLLARLAVRARDFERVMDSEFLARMRSEYAHVCQEAHCTIIEVDCDAQDFRRPDERRGLVERVRGAVGLPDS
jgi:deoxyguanosine kinase